MGEAHDPDVITALSQALRDHGAPTFPLGEFDCCAEVVLDTLLALPVEQRMRAMRMVPTYDWHDNRPTYAEALPANEIEEWDSRDAG